MGHAHALTAVEMLVTFGLPARLGQGGKDGRQTLPNLRHARDKGARMKAVICKEYGPPEKLVLEDLPSPEPAAGQVLVSVRAAGVNFPDTLIIDGKYQFKPA